MNGFNTLTIEEVTERLIDYRGKTPPKTNSGVRLVTAKVVKGGQIHEEPAEYIANDFYEKWMRRGLPKKFDVLLTTEAPLGEVAILRDDSQIALAQRIILLRAKPGLLDPAYLFYALQSEFGQGELKARASGTTVLGIKQSELRKVRVPMFPLPVQQRIAGILSAYDDLIENSQRRIRIMESMARALYREWFVHFRFPGHEYHPRVASSLGEIPQGWEVKKLGAVFQTVLGGTPSRTKPEYWENGTIAWINSGKVNDLRITEPSELITELALNKSAAKLMPKGATVLAITGATLGQVSYLEIETTANQSVVGVIDPSACMSELIYLFVCERIEGIIKHASGGAQQHINKEVVNDVLIALPDSELTARFKVLVEPMFKGIAALLFQVKNLRATRDLLLPRLLSGQIPVETEAA